MTSEQARRAADSVRAKKQTKKDRGTRRREEQSKTKDLQQGRGLKELRRATNPTLYIPYNSLLTEDGYLGYHMSRKILARKKEIMDEMSNIIRVEEKYVEEFKRFGNGKNGADRN